MKLLIIMAMFMANTVFGQDLWYTAKTKTIINVQNKDSKVYLTSGSAWDCPIVEWKDRSGTTWKTFLCEGTEHLEVQTYSLDEYKELVIYD